MALLESNKNIQLNLKRKGYFTRILTSIKGKKKQKFQG